MQSPRDIKKRIKSVSNTAQITRAMEAVSATKMRKSQGFALAARPYAVASLEMLKNLLSRVSALPPLLLSRPVKKTALLVVTSDKGLAGAFNAAALKKAQSWMEKRKGSGVPVVLFTVGKKAKDYFERRSQKIEKSFWGFGDFSAIFETMPVAEVLLGGFSDNSFDEVEAVYTHFRTTLKQEAVIKKILPATEYGIQEAVREILPEYGKYSDMALPASKPVYQYEYKFEPSADEIFNFLVPQLLRLHIHHIILESNASEHSARMVAMKNASKNAGEMIDNLSLVYNKARQAGITKELTEITAGANSLDR